ncbi:hypothetical protein GCM10010216_18650 [Streptomyces flaveolus]|nr:hypothetical protein GCM10010216_18650 [Streptomyces flaveolus]
MAAGVSGKGLTQGRRAPGKVVDSSLPDRNNGPGIAGTNGGGRTRNRGSETSARPGGRPRSTGMPVGDRTSV